MKTKPIYYIVSHTFPGEHGTDRAAASLYCDHKPAKLFKGATAHRDAQVALKKAREGK